VKYRAVIFDLDGTIINSTGAWNNAIISFIKLNGIDLNEHSLQKLKKQLCGLGQPECVDIFKKKFGLKESVDQIEQLFEQELVRLVVNAMENNVHFIEGFVDFHRQAITSGLKTGIATNSNDTCLELVTKKFNLNQFFGEHIYNLTDVGNVGKPRPDLYLHVAKQLGVSPEECVVIEDSSCGIKAAVDAGMFCFGINTAGQEDLLQQADVIIDKYHEIDLFRLLKKHSH
jgi:HAD superfamily hydrolase (TIGR01509 family)